MSDTDKQVPLAVQAECVEAPDNSQAPELEGFRQASNYFESHTTNNACSDNNIEGVSGCDDKDDADHSDGDGDGSEGEADSIERDGDGSGGDGYDRETDESDDSDASDTEMDRKCNGKPYTTRCVLSCPLHALLYQIECERVAKKAADVVHTEMGRGHSNLPESKFNVLTRFRPKSVNLQQKHYEFITNIGLCQSNLTFMYNTAGKEYHWMRSVLSLMKLPVPDGIQDVWTRENTRHIKALEDIDEHSAVEEAKARLAKGGNTLNYEQTAPPIGATVSVGGRKCKCGSSTHVRAGHKSCKFYKSKAQ